MHRLRNNGYSNRNDYCELVKCVLVGEACVGKTSLIVAYTTNGFSDRYIPTAFDNYSVTVNVDDNPLKLELCDTAGRSEFDSIRPLSYADANVFVLCFSVAKPETLRAITDRWLPELQAASPSTPVILVGTQSDLRLNRGRMRKGLPRSGENDLVEWRTVSRIANEFGVEYIECSSITHHNLKEVFDLAILYGLNRRRRPAPTNNGTKEKNNKPANKWILFPEKTIIQEKAKKPAQTTTLKDPLKEGFRRLMSMTRRFV
ncbi:ras family domain-containing protein [Ditylenchus destructor]|uniref:Ras family domain-containing protein n=1 Tax=Ditylenchus destructor TaxID=166010 RepID=A0AAD4NBR9_9BILA|nr:ras family domain-containing protein [Ditylenchus destructor]